MIEDIFLDHRDQHYLLTITVIRYNSYKLEEKSRLNLL